MIDMHCCTHTQDRYPYNYQHAYMYVHDPAARLGSANQLSRGRLAGGSRMQNET